MHSELADKHELAGEQKEPPNICHDGSGKTQEQHSHYKSVINLVAEDTAGGHGLGFRDR
jgi:hypothetical protein